MSELVSIIIANYNYGHYLSESIESALQQSWPNIEVIYIDDGSTDNSLEIATQYPITVLSQENQWVAAARNNAVQFAKGKYIFFLDADDHLAPNAIEYCVKLITSSPPEVGYIYGQMEYFEHKQGLFPSAEFDPKTLARDNYICVSALIKRDEFIAAGGFDKGLIEGREDWEFYVRLYQRGVEGQFLAEPLILCRKHRPPSQKRSGKRKNISSAKLVYKHPRFFWRRFLKHPLRHLFFIAFYPIADQVNLYGPNLDRQPQIIKQADRQ